MHSNPLKNTQCQQKLHKLRTQIRNRQIQQYKRKIRKQYLSTPGPPSTDNTDKHKQHNRNVQNSQYSDNNTTTNSYMDYLQILNQDGLYKQIQKVVQQLSRWHKQREQNYQSTSNKNNSYVYPTLNQEQCQYQYLCAYYNKLIDILIYTQDKYPHLYTTSPHTTNNNTNTKNLLIHIRQILQTLSLYSKHSLQSWSVQQRCIISYYMQAYLRYWLCMYEQAGKREEKQDEQIVGQQYDKYMHVIQFMSMYMKNILIKQDHHHGYNYSYSRGYSYGIKQDNYNNNNSNSNTNNNSSTNTVSNSRYRYSPILDINKIQQYILMQLVQAMSYIMSHTDISMMIELWVSQQMGCIVQDTNYKYKNMYKDKNKDKSKDKMDTLSISTNTSIGRLSSVLNTITKSYTTYIHMYIQQQQFNKILTKNKYIHPQHTQQPQQQISQTPYSPQTPQTSQIGNINLQSLKHILTLHTQYINTFICTLQQLTPSLYTQPELGVQASIQQFIKQIHINRQCQLYIHTIFKQQIEIGINCVVELYGQLCCIVGIVPVSVYKSMEDQTSNGIYETVIGGMLGLTDGIVNGVRVLEDIQQRRDDVTATWINWNRSTLNQQNIKEIQHIVHLHLHHQNNTNNINNTNSIKYSKIWFQSIKLKQLTHCIYVLVQKPLYVKQYIAQLYTYSKLPIFVLMCIFNTTPIYVPIQEEDGNRNIQMGMGVNNYQQYRKSRSRFTQSVCLEMECLKLIESLMMGYSIKVDSEDNLQVRYLKKIGDGTPNQFYYRKLSGFN